MMSSDRHQTALMNVVILAAEDWFKLYQEYSDGSNQNE